MNELLDKKVLITGSSRGIGRATAAAMARAGADVAINYRRREDAAQEAAREVEELGRKCLVIKADIENLEEVDAMFDRIKEAWGSLDVFVANAAATAFKPLAELKDYHLERTYRVIVTSVLRSAQRCLELMEGHGGRIITLSSLGGEFTLPRYASIGSAKAALNSLTRYIAAEYGPRNITCNAISPGVVDTDSADFYAGENTPAFHEDVIRRTPLGRLATAEDVADVAVFLASDASRFITGQMIRVDGGLTLAGNGFDRA
jgi:enoyl-[acyl-carrier protein] reductase III